MAKRPRTTNHEPRTTNHEPRTTNHEPPESVHLCEFPTANAAARDLDLERRMADVQAVVELGRRLRADNDLKVRQPLSVLKVAGGDVKGLESLIEDELNV